MGESFTINLPTLMETRLLVAANSGGGKSWALRRLLEQTNGEVQQIVIDLEGEFYTLREQFDDYILIGKDGDMPANVQASALLAIKLLELGVSAIIDLSELKFHERKRFVRLFLESLVEAPEELRHPCMVVLDEAHHFCPQVGESEATAAVIDLMTRGRKRQLCGVLATQRVSKLHKDAIAECNNKMFGRTGQDIDIKRTSDELGFAQTKREAFDTLRNLAAGEFFAFGTAIGHNVEKYKVGNVKSEHFRRGKRAGRKTTAPKSAIKAVLEKLSNLPKEAETKTKNEAELRKEVATLKATITRLEKQPNGEYTEEEFNNRLKNHITAIESEREAWKSTIEKWVAYAEMLEHLIAEIPAYIKQRAQDIADKPRKEAGARYAPEKDVRKPVPAPRVETPVQAPKTINEGEYVAISGKTLAVLQAVASFYPESATRSQVAVIAQVKKRASTLRNAISKLRTSGLIEVQGETLTATPEGIASIGGQPAPATPEEKIERWRNTFSGSTLDMFNKLVELYGEETSREDLALSLGMDTGVSTFRNCLSKLNASGVVEVNGSRVRLSVDLIE